MEFTLYIHGQINSNDNTRAIHKIRQELHYQLKHLWELDPWKKNGKYPWQKNKLEDIGLDVWKIENELFQERHGKNFICLAKANLNMYVELSFNFFVPKDTSFRDIDNKLKTLCDALKLPDKRKRKEDVPEEIKKWAQNKKENPLVCLLEDDDLIYKLSAETDFFLDGRKKFFESKENKSRHQMLCVINVKIKGNRDLGQYNDLII